MWEMEERKRRADWQAWCATSEALMLAARQEMMREVFRANAAMWVRYRSAERVAR